MRPLAGSLQGLRFAAAAEEKVRREPATLFMELRGGLDEDDTSLRRPRRREIECPRPALSSAPTWRAFVSFAAKALSQRRIPSHANQYAFRRSDAASNRDFELDLKAHLEPRSPWPAGASTCFSLLRRICYGEIISLLPSCSSCTANLLKPLLVK
jgi:hypothetical protein